MTGGAAQPVQTSLRDSPEAFAIQIIGVKPHRVQAEFLNCRTPTKVACMGRQIGKSFCCALDIIWFAITRPGTEQWIIAPTADQAEIIFDYVVSMCQNSTILRSAIGKPKSSPFHEVQITLPRSMPSIIRARGTGPTGMYIRGHKADRIIFDEYAWIPSNVVTEVAPQMLATSPYKEIVAISTPFGMDHFWDLWQSGQGHNPRIKSFQFPSWESPFISEEFIEDRRASMPSIAFDVEIGAQFREDQNAVFPGKLIQERRVDIGVPMPAERGHHYSAGFDPAKYHDRSGIVIVDKVRDVKIPVFIDDIGGRDYDVQARRVAAVGAQYGKPIWRVDTTKEESMIHLLENVGVKSKSYPFTANSKDELISHLVIELEQDRVKLPNHPDLLREMKYYRFERKGQSVKLGAPENVTGMYDDLVTALALAVWQADIGKRRLIVSPGSLTRTRDLHGL